MLFASLSDFHDCVAAYEKAGLHYDLIASSIYAKRREFLRKNNLGDPPTGEYLRYVAAGLVAFDMGRLMGPAASRYESAGFLGRLQNSLGVATLTNAFQRLSTSSLATLEFDAQQEQDIQVAHDELSASWVKGAKSVTSRVGASKILHWLYPDVFIMSDRYVRKALGNGTYLAQMKQAKSILVSLGVTPTPEAPVTRLLDKAIFARSAGWC